MPSGGVFAALQSADAAGISLGGNVDIFSAVNAATTSIKSKVALCNDEPSC